MADADTPCVFIEQPSLLGKPDLRIVRHVAQGGERSHADYVERMPLGRLTG